MRNFKSLVFSGLIISSVLSAQSKADWQAGVPEGCTTITVGRKASSDGSVMTSHTDDSHRTRSWVDIIPEEKHGRNDKVTMYKRENDDSRPMPAYQHTPLVKFHRPKGPMGMSIPLTPV